MQENLNVEIETQSALKGRFSAAVTIILAVISAVLVLISALACSAAFNKNSENTAQLFGYKFFYCENDIEGTDIKAGSLIVIKNSDNDEFYEADFLSENAVLIVSNLGSLIKNNGFYVTLCIATPFIFTFAVILTIEIKKLYSRRAQKPICELEFKEIPEEEFILDD